MPDAVAVAADDVQALSQFMSIAVRAFARNLAEVPGFGQALEAMGRMERAAESPQMPDDPHPPHVSAAIVRHQLMEASMAAGFDRHEAFALVLMEATALAHAQATIIAAKGMAGG